LCPRTLEVLLQAPSIRGAMFAYLPPGGLLTRHADPVAVSLRYHLGLATPNSDECFINVDGRKLSWRDGEVLMFDETYLHFVCNGTPDGRLILMCDVKRPLNLLGAVFGLFYDGLTSLSVVPNTSEDKRGLANRIFEGIQPLLSWSKVLKTRNRRLYFVAKWSFNLLLVSIIVGVPIGLVMLLNGMI